MYKRSRMGQRALTLAWACLGFRSRGKLDHGNLSRLSRNCPLTLATVECNSDPGADGASPQPTKTGRLERKGPFCAFASVRPTTGVILMPTTHAYPVRLGDHRKLSGLSSSRRETLLRSPFCGSADLSENHVFGNLS